MTGIVDKFIRAGNSFRLGVEIHAARPAKSTKNHAP